MNRRRRRSVCPASGGALSAVLFLVLAACGRQEPAPAPPPRAAESAKPAPKIAAKPEDVGITGVHTGLGIGRYNRVAREKAVFAPGDTVALSVYSDGSAKTATIKVVWIGPGARVLAEDTKDVTYNGSLATPFLLKKAEGLPAGAYKAEVYLNDWPAETAEFEVTRSTK